MYLLEDTPEAADMRQNVVNLLASPDVDNALLALQLIQAGGLHTDFITGLCAHVIEERWRYEEEKPFLKFWEKKRLFLPKGAHLLPKWCKNCYQWSDITEFLAKKVEKDSQCFIAPYWRDVVLLGYYWSGQANGVACVKYGIVSERDYLESLVYEDTYYQGDPKLVLNLYFADLEDLPDALADMKVDTLNLWGNPFTQIRRKRWQNTHITRVGIPEHLPPLVSRIIYMCFPAYVQALLQDKYTSPTISLLKSAPKEARDEKFYKQCAELYKKEGNLRMAVHCYHHLLRLYPYPEECFKFKIAACYAQMRQKEKMLYWLQEYIAETPYDVQKDVHLAPEFDRYRKSRELKKLLKTAPPSVYLAS